jgi:hypothetical protein
MSLIRRKPDEKPKHTLINLHDAAAMLNLDESTIRKGCAGTAHLTKVRQGTGKRQRISLLLDEVEDHIHSLVEYARSKNTGAASSRLHEQND